MSLRRGLAGLLALGLMAGCGTPGADRYASREANPSPGETEAPGGPAPGATYKVGEPYSVKGVTYVPRENFSYDETGIASWYGRKFHGSRTASGEIYDMNALTAAHKTLPLPSIVKVTNLENGRRLRVRVNDRGPFARGRIIDLSRRAAELLGMRKTGTARVRVQIDGKASREIRRALRQGERPDLRTASLSPPDLAEGQGRDTSDGSETAASATDTIDGAAGGSADGGESGTSQPVQVDRVAPRDTALFVQVGAFVERANARRLATELAPFGSVKTTQVRLDGRLFHRVRLGPLATVDQADKRLAQIHAAGYDQARLVVDW